jgi:hypothetical protein
MDDTSGTPAGKNAPVDLTVGDAVRTAHHNGHEYDARRSHDHDGRGSGEAAVHPLRRLADNPALGSGRGIPRQVRLSIVMPAHNEERTVAQAISLVLDQPMSCWFELVIVDDGSTDATPELIAAFDDPRITVVRHPLNLGKGVAVLSGAKAATGTHLLVFDADLEYSPRDIPRLLAPVMAGHADVVYGARLFGMNTLYPSFRYALGNRATTLAANVLFDACLTDLHTCLKLIPLDVFRSLSLSERGFGLDTEITAELLRHGLRPYEVPVSYSGRSRAEGKQLTWRDGVRCLSVLGSVRLRSRRVPARGVPIAIERSVDLDLGETRGPVGLPAAMESPRQGEGWEAGLVKPGLVNLRAR